MKSDISVAWIRCKIITLGLGVQLSHRVCFADPRPCVQYTTSEEKAIFTDVVMSSLWGGVRADKGRIY